MSQPHGSRAPDSIDLARSLEGVEPGSVAVVLGTRPEIIKLASVVESLGDRARVIFTGQHYDPEMSAFILAELGIEAIDEAIEVGGLSRGVQIGNAVAGLDRLFAVRRPRAVVVQGDTNTALAGGLAANASDVPLVHVEAGLRSHDRRMPEEHNRVLVDHLADLLCAPTAIAAANLAREGIPPERVVETGNTVVEAVQRHRPEGETTAGYLRSIGVTGGFVLATLHRPENVDDPDRFTDLLETLAGCGRPVIYPIHPRSRARIESPRAQAALDRLTAIPPVDYGTFLGLADAADLIVSDSGGVQEEVSVLKRRVIVTRRSTERPEVEGTFARLVRPSDQLAPIVDQELSRVESTRADLADLPSPYGDGSAGRRTVQLIGELVG